MSGGDRASASSVTGGSPLVLISHHLKERTREDENHTMTTHSLSCSVELKRELNSSVNWGGGAGDRSDCERARGESWHISSRRKELLSIN